MESTHVRVEEAPVQQNAIAATKFVFAKRKRGSDGRFTMQNETDDQNNSGSLRSERENAIGKRTRP